MPHKTMTLKMCCSTYPIVSSLDYFSTFNESLDQFKMYCSSYPMVLNVNYFSAYNEALEQFENVL